VFNSTRPATTLIHSDAKLISLFTVILVGVLKQFVISTSNKNKYFFHIVIIGLHIMYKFIYFYVTLVTCGFASHK
jgi:hypothetical protein